MIMKVMPRNFLTLLAVGFGLISSGCGFEPLYGDRAGETPTRLELAAVEVGPIPERLGQQVRNALVDRLNPGAEPHRSIALKCDLRANLKALAFVQTNL